MLDVSYIFAWTRELWNCLIVILNSPAVSSWLATGTKGGGLGCVLTVLQVPCHEMFGINLSVLRLCLTCAFNHDFVK